VKNIAVPGGAGRIIQLPGSIGQDDLAECVPRKRAFAAKTGRLREFH
jgi:hypothetical protein